MLSVDSAERYPNDLFASQLGTWKEAGNDRIVRRTINFRYPPGIEPGPHPGIVLSDYVISLAPDRHHVTGTISLKVFSLEDGSPGEDEGTPLGAFTFQGEWIKP